MEIQLARDQQKRLEQYAADRGMTLEQATTELASAELERRYRLRRSNGEVVPIRGLKRPEDPTR